jgi:hypothetical protein
MAKEKTIARPTGKASLTEQKEKQDIGFAIPSDSYKFIIIGFAVVILGFILMAGGGSDDPSVFNPEVFSPRRITLAPIVVVAGFIVVGWAIMRKPKAE